MIFQIRRNIEPKGGSHIGYFLFPGDSIDSLFVEILVGGMSSIDKYYVSHCGDSEMTL